jgi:ribosomal protein L9
LLDTYPQLVSRSESIGYSISKVVFRGYLATDALQSMHNNAIERRTQLILEQETEEQSQKLADYKLTKEKLRSVEQLKMAEEASRSKMRMEKEIHDSEIIKMTEIGNLKLDQQKKEADLVVEKEKALKGLELPYLRSLLVSNLW